MNPIPKVPHLLYGGDYNPEQWPPAVWREDVMLMKEAGVNLISLGIFSWAWIQPREGFFDFDWLDEVINLLHSQGISVNLATATASPPAWLVKKHPEILPVTSSGATLGPGSRQHYAPWSSVYRKYATELVIAIALRYRNHPALVSWHINNELACHVKESFDPETTLLWQQWVEKRHGTIGQLNHAWNTAFWSQRYNSFAEIEAPRAAPTTLNPGMVLDWRRFSAEAFTDLVRMEKKILNEISPDIPINTNFVGWHDAPLCNHRDIAAEIDYVSWDSYPDPDDGLAGIRANALCHDFMRSLKPGRPFILMEQATSLVNWRASNLGRPPGVMRALSHQALARGADGVLFFQWRQSAAGAEQFHSAMVPISGLQFGNSENRIWQSVKDLGRELKLLSPIAGSTTFAQVALLTDYESTWAVEYDSKPIKFNVCRDLNSFYKPLWDRNISADIRHPEDNLSRYRLVIVPTVMLLSAKSIANLRAFVASGGSLLFSPFCAVTDTSTRIHAGNLPGGLSDLFGYTLEEWWPLGAGLSKSINGKLGEMKWERFAELGHATTAEVIATFTEDWFNGRPAITRNIHKKGSAWYLAAMLEPKSLDRLIGLILEEVNVKGVANTPEGVEATLRTNAGNSYCHLINHTEIHQDFSVNGLKGIDLITGKQIEYEIHMEPFGVAVVSKSPSTNLCF